MEPNLGNAAFYKFKRTCFVQISRKNQVSQESDRIQQRAHCFHESWNGADNAAASASRVGGIRKLGDRFVPALVAGGVEGLQILSTVEEGWSVAKLSRRIVVVGCAWLCVASYEWRRDHVVVEVAVLGRL